MHALHFRQHMFCQIHCFDNDTKSRFSTSITGTIVVNDVSLYYGGRSCVTDRTSTSGARNRKTGEGNKEFDSMLPRLRS